MRSSASWWLSVSSSIGCKRTKPSPHTRPKPPSNSNSLTASKAAISSSAKTTSQSPKTICALPPSISIICNSAWLKNHTSSPKCRRHRWRPCASSKAKLPLSRRPWPTAMSSLPQPAPILPSTILPCRRSCPIRTTSSRSSASWPSSRRSAAFCPCPASARWTAWSAPWTWSCSKKTSIPTPPSKSWPLAPRNPFRSFSI